MYTERMRKEEKCVRNWGNFVLSCNEKDSGGQKPKKLPTTSKKIWLKTK